MYQFSVSNPKNKKLAIHFIREHSHLTVNQAFLAIANHTPAIELDYRDDLVELDFIEWIEKVKKIYKIIDESFDSVTIGFAASDVVEIVTKEQFFNLLSSDVEYHEQEHD